MICPVCKVVIRSTRELREGDRVYCMPCMRELERNPHDFQDTRRGNWENVYDTTRRYIDEPTRFDLAALEHD